MNAISKGVTVYDVYDRAKSGPKMEEKEWDFKVIPQTAKKLAKKYDIKMDKKTIIPEDKELCDKLFNAGLDLLVECGIYCIDTGRVIKYTRDEVLHALASAPDHFTYGEGKEAIQVVPSVRFSVPYRGDAFTLYRRLRRFNASPYMFYMHFPDITLFGSSPEVMVRCQEDSLQLSPIAGTRRRGHTPEEDMKFEKELLSDPKEKAEHVMLVDLGRNDLGRIAEKGTVRVERLMQIERFSHVMHMTSQVSAVLKKGMDPVDVLAATFPAGTVSGAPKIRAMEIIREMEGGPRGPYAGCIGWLGLDKDTVNLDFGITIRSMWMRGGRLAWQAGAGIVHDSVPELEWKEVNNKTAIMKLALQSEDGNYVSLNR